jgi:hypothetical protein
MTDNVTGICESKYNFNISTFIDHAIVRSMFMLSFIFVIVCDLFEWMQICIKVFLSFVYICIGFGDPIIKKGGLGFH